MIVRLPDTIIVGSRDMVALAPPARLAVYLDPHYVSLVTWGNQVAMELLRAGVLAATVGRAHRRMHRQVAAEQARTSLAHYVSPNLVERLVALEEPFGGFRRQPVAVLFVDIVGFTLIAERLAPERTIALLRSFHQRMARCVFDHGGTLDDYVGDEVMAVFGTPTPDPSDPARALACGCAMIEEVERGNAKRSAHGGFPVSVGVGIYVGDVVVGNTGDEWRLKFAFAGDRVNLASRLERLTRTFGAALVVGDDLLTKARLAGAPVALCNRFIERSRLPLRGREHALAVRWQHRSTAIPAAATNL